MIVVSWAAVDGNSSALSGGVTRSSLVGNAGTVQLLTQNEA